MAYRAYVWRKENPDKRTEQKKREKVRGKLRKLGIFPPVGKSMNEYQQKINEQISNNDFSFWDELKTKVGVDHAHPQVKTQKEKPEYLIWYRAKSNAKVKGYDFDLEVGDIVIPEKCPYLNLPITTNYEERQSKNYFSIDRIDSTKGYVKGNVQVISLLANTMKNNASSELLIMFAESVLKLHK